jgi:hypothetical protein
MFEVRLANNRTLALPFAKTEPPPSAQDPIEDLRVDADTGRETFTYTLRSGETGTVHAEQVLEYNKDPDHLRDLLLYRLTLEAQKRIAASPLSKREIVRRLETSAAQLYRLLDQTNYRKSVDQLVALLQVLDCEVDLVVRTKTA